MAVVVKQIMHVEQRFFPSFCMSSIINSIAVAAVEAVAVAAFAVKRVWHVKTFVQRFFLSFFVSSMINPAREAQEASFQVVAQKALFRQQARLQRECLL